MTIFQILMLGVTAFLAYKVYEHINGLEDTPNQNSDTYAPEEIKEQISSKVSAEELENEADEAFENGDIIKAKELLSKANEQEKNISVLNKLGYIASQEQNYKEAISYAQEALTLDGNDESVHGAIASFYRHEKEYEKADEHFKKSIAIDDTNEYTHFNYANLLVEMNDTNRAKVHYQKALLLKPDFLQAQFELEKLS